jgi:hypothetical protein
MRNSNAPRCPFLSLAGLTMAGALLASGCTTIPATSGDDHGVVPVSRVAPPAENSATLLVSLADGSIIGQTAPVDADICMKSNDSPLTQCLTRGAPIYDRSGRTLIGYRMERSEIELVGR